MMDVFTASGYLSHDHTISVCPDNNICIHVLFCLISGFVFNKAREGQSGDRNFYCKQKLSECINKPGPLVESSFCIYKAAMNKEKCMALYSRYNCTCYYLFVFASSTQVIRIYINQVQQSASAE
jgi:hypothetical protein